MLKNRLLHYAIVFQFAGLLAHNGLAFERVGADEFLSLCAAFTMENQHQENPSINNDKALCAMYIKGFLAGEEIHRDHYKPDPTFEQRAIKTRVSGLLDKMGGSDDPKYCIPESTTMEHIVTLINHQDGVRGNTAEALLENVLRKNFQCDK